MKTIDFSPYFFTKQKIIFICTNETAYIKRQQFFPRKRPQFHRLFSHPRRQHDKMPGLQDHHQGRAARAQPQHRERAEGDGQLVRGEIREIQEPRRQLCLDDDGPQTSSRHKSARHVPMFQVRDDDLRRVWCLPALQKGRTEKNAFLFLIIEKMSTTFTFSKRCLDTIC